MDTVLAQLNGVPGVVGSLVCDAEGRVLSQAFPPLFDASLLGEAATALADSVVGLEMMTGAVNVLDFRFADSRVVVKPLSGAMLVMLCAKSINVQMLHISASVATKKLAKLVQDAQAPAPSGTPAPAQPEKARAAAPLPGADPKKPAKAEPRKADAKQEAKAAKKAKEPKWWPSM